MEEKYVYKKILVAMGTYHVKQRLHEIVCVFRCECKAAHKVWADVCLRFIRTLLILWAQKYDKR